MESTVSLYPCKIGHGTESDILRIIDLMFFLLFYRFKTAKAGVEVKPEVSESDRGDFPLLPLPASPEYMMHLH